MDDLRDDQGKVSPERVNEAIDGLLEERPHWSKPEPEPEPPDNGYPDLHGGARQSPPSPGPSFGEMLKRA